MLSIAPECKSLPEGLGVIPEDMANLFDVRHPTPVRPRGKGRVTASLETGGRKRADDTVRGLELSNAAWRKKDRVTADTGDKSERYGRYFTACKVNVKLTVCFRSRADVPNQCCACEPLPTMMSLLAHCTPFCIACNKIIFFRMDISLCFAAMVDLVALEQMQDGGLAKKQMKMDYGMHRHQAQLAQQMDG